MKLLKTVNNFIIIWESEAMQNKMDHEEPKQSSKPPLKHYDYKYIKSFISGGLAGIAAKSLIAPFDRIKILFQVKSFWSVNIHSKDNNEDLYLQGCLEGSSRPL